MIKLTHPWPIPWDRQQTSPLFSANKMRICQMYIILAFIFCVSKTRCTSVSGHLWSTFLSSWKSMNWNLDCCWHSRVTNAQRHSSISLGSCSKGRICRCFWKPQLLMTSKWAKSHWYLRVTVPRESPRHMKCFCIYWDATLRKSRLKLDNARRFCTTEIY